MKSKNKKTSRPINTKAKKYAPLRKKQALANRFIREQRKTLGDNHKVVNNFMNNFRTFQKTHGLKVQNRLSMQGLKTKDVEVYEQLLDSIINSTYMNPEKYKNFTTNQLNYVMNQGWANTEEEAKRIYDFANSNIVEDLKDLARIDIPSKIVEKYVKYIQGNLTKEEFANMASTFMKYYSSEDMTTSEFFDFADTYYELAKVNKEQDKNGISMTTEEMMDNFISEGIVAFVGTEDFKKAAREYSESPKGKDNKVSTFIDYFKYFYL